MTAFPDVDTDISVYKAAVVYQIEDYPRFVFPGGFDNFKSAADKANRLCTALIAAGEHMTIPHVTFGGERPEGFPRNGVTLERPKAEKTNPLPDDYAAPMTGAELSEIALELHGQKHGRAVNLMRLTGLSRPTIDRQMGGETVDPVLSRLARLLLIFG